ncbi:MAG: dockerin type I domain-containing protein [Planctomycetota bacterium]
MNSKNILLRSTIAILLALAAPAVAGTVSWDGDGGDGDWANPLNWTDDAVPLPGDVVYTDTAVDLTARSVTVDAGGEYYLRNFTGSFGTLAVGGEGDGWAEVANAALDCAILQVGLFEGASGAMQVETLDAGRVTVGASGQGFLQLDGPMTSNAGTVGLFHRASGDMLVTEFGEWTCDELIVGSYGSGNLTLEPGAEVAAETAIVGFAEGVSGSVSLSNGARLDATDALLIGYSGTGSLDVTNAGQVDCGMAVIGGKWELMEPGAGTVTVSGNSHLGVDGDLFVGESGAGSLMVSSHGSVIFTDAYIGYMPEAQGDVTLDGLISLMHGTNAFVGGYGRGSITLNAGSELNLSGRCYLGYHPGGEGVLAIGGNAKVHADRFYLGGEAVEGSLGEGDSVELQRRDGRIEVDGVGQIICDRGFAIGACGEVTATPLSQLHLTLEAGAAFSNASTDAAALDGLLVASLGCIDGDGVTTVEVAAADEGPAVPQMDLTGRFAMRKLVLVPNAAAMLVDDTTNQFDGGAPEALYVDELKLGAGSALDLNGLSLYYRALVDEGGTVSSNGGTLAQIYTAGDVDGDGDVDLDDFTALKQNFGTTTGATRADGDMNGDGAVDLDDFMILKQNYGFAPLN